MEVRSVLGDSWRRYTILVGISNGNEGIFQILGYGYGEALKPYLGQYNIKALMWRHSSMFALGMTRLFPRRRGSIAL